MDAQVWQALLLVLSGILSIFVTVLAWNFKDVKEKVERTDKELAEFKTEVASTYVNNSVLRDVVSDVKNMFRDYESKMEQRLGRIEDKLDQMRNRP